MFTILAILFIALFACYIVAVLELDQPVGTPDTSDLDVEQFVSIRIPVTSTPNHDRYAERYSQYHSSNAWGR